METFKFWGQVILLGMFFGGILAWFSLSCVIMGYGEKVCGL